MKKNNMDAQTILENEKKSDTNASKKASKPASKAKKPGVFKKIVKFFRDTRGEFKKIVWPTKKTVINNTGIVIATIIVCGLVIWAFDLGCSSLIALILNTK